ncbi:hypothetical protein PVAG01_05154 [Phlyctema vagabunda]|uniref:Uncharacterized protein n=1 Tax=Phlyctema vagabunda TaxID=108571 RepID=A0ABR4PJ96_9HELO
MAIQYHKPSTNSANLKRMCHLRVKKYACGHKFMTRLDCPYNYQYVCPYGHRKVEYEATVTLCELCIQRAEHMKEHELEAGNGTARSKKRKSDAKGSTDTQL